MGSGPNLSVSITSGPSGENPTGSLTADFSGAHFQTTAISCFAVDGNKATFAAPVEPNLFGVTFIKVTFVDNGPGPGVDTFGASGNTVPYDCASPLAAVNTVLGDIVVVDAPPLPTTLAQCMNGGWQSYAVFKNQGDCVSFVATSGKNVPART
jgi:hypothetical protein